MTFPAPHRRVYPAPPLSSTLYVVVSVIGDYQMLEIGLGTVIALLFCTTNQKPIGGTKMKLRNRKTFETVEVAEQDANHFLTTDDRLIER